MGRVCSLVRVEKLAEGRAQRLVISNQSPASMMLLESLRKYGAPYRTKYYLYIFPISILSLHFQFYLYIFNTIFSFSILSLHFQYYLFIFNTIFTFSILSFHFQYYVCKFTTFFYALVHFFPQFT